MFFCIGCFVGEGVKQQGKKDIIVLNSMKIANGELRDVHGPYQGILQNVMWFHAARVNVISIKPIRKIRLSAAIFTNFINAQRR